MVSGMLNWSIILKYARSDWEKVEIEENAYYTGLT
jgi:hypothetical protein